MFTFHFVRKSYGAYGVNSNILFIISLSYLFFKKKSSLKKEHM